MEIACVKQTVEVKMHSTEKGNHSKLVKAYCYGPLCYHLTPGKARGVYSLTLTLEGIAVVSHMRIARWKIDEFTRLLVEKDGDAWYAPVDELCKNHVLKKAVTPLHKYK